MRYIRKCIIGSLALPLLLLSCTDNGLTLGVPNVGSASGDLVRMELNISTPEAFSTRNSTRTITEDCDSTLDGRFAVFGFTYEGNDTILQFVLKTGEMSDDETPLYSTGDTNTESNLNGSNEYVTDYGDYTTSPSIAWHAADASSTSGRLYIEYWETPEPVHLLVLSNVDPTAVAALLTADETTGETAAITIGTSTFEEVTNAIAPALDFNVYDESINSIPMAAECDLQNGITLGSTGSISLRRSVAKFTVRVQYSMERVEEDYDGSIDNVPFHPESLQIVNVNSYATVYAPNDTLPNISTLNDEDYDEDYKVSPIYYFEEGEWTQGVTGTDAEDIYYKEVVFYVAETMNSKQNAYTSGTPNTTNPRISVLVGGNYYDEEQEKETENWYRLDLIPESAESADAELDCILRNHHYNFVIRNVDKIGSTTEDEALQLPVPDNEPRVVDDAFLVWIEDEDIISITVETNPEGEGVPYYVGVSSTSMELDIAYGTAACARVKVATNFEGWTIDYYSIPQATDESGDPLTDSDGNPIYAISFVWDENSYTLWLWLDYPEDVEVGKTYAFYIVAGNIRKKMNITIGNSSDDGTDGDDTGDTP